MNPYRDCTWELSRRDTSGPFLLEADWGVTGEGPERQQQGRPENRPEIDAAGSISDENRCRARFLARKPMLRAPSGPSNSVSSPNLARAAPAFWPNPSLGRRFWNETSGDLSPNFGPFPGDPPIGVRSAPRRCHTQTMSKIAQTHTREHVCDACENPSARHLI